MLSWLKKRLVDWAEKVQQREIARLREESQRLKEEIERETGHPIQLTPDERRLLAEKASRIDLQTLKQISVLNAEDLTSADLQVDSAENR